MQSQTPWIFAQKFIPEFYKNMGRFLTESEIDEAERDWVDYLGNKGEVVGDEIAKVHYRFNNRGEVVDAIVVDELQL
jgi:hypothetical protein